ncbi:hypothetical protein HUG15_08130 [Salicibibacter cibarius]|uniref:Uncharacterized protein n=1 Tax=Salicibibacter cibarius TaxID=2743000 RepID=A0A7T6Z221_9BACI|nr:hypothetical protein [Salicibibacter cibarius]QQK75553.1 hypothetical protein HUG15_08130 [Salicibibacter cibarius]
MALVALTVFIIAGVSTVFAAFLMFVTWPRRKQNEYKQIKLFTGSFSAAIVTLGIFLLFTDSSSNKIAADESYAVPDDVETVEEEAGWHITSELGQVTADHHEVIQSVSFNKGGEDQRAVLEAELITEDNITTDLIRTSTLNRSTQILQRLSQIDEVEQIHLVWDIYFEPESGPGEFDTILDLTVNKENVQNIEGNRMDSEELDELAVDYWEKPALDPEDE